MPNLIRRILDMVLRVLGFLHANPSDDPAYLAAVARLEQDAAKLLALAAQEQTGHIEASAAVVTKQELREGLQDALTLLARLAVIATREFPSIPVRLSIPKPHSSQRAFLTGARAVVAEARAQQEPLTQFGMTPGFLDQMAGTLDQYELAISAKDSGIIAHVGASAELQEVAVEVVRLVRLLDAIQRPRFRNDPEKRAAWKSAHSIVRRTPKPEPAQPPKDSVDPAA